MHPLPLCHMSSTACQQPNRIVGNYFKPTHSFRHKSSQHTRTATPLLRCSACAVTPSSGRCSAWQSPSAGRNVAPLVSRLVSRGRRSELLAGVFRARAGIVLRLERCNLVSVCQWRVSFVCQHWGFLLSCCHKLQGAAKEEIVTERKT